MSRLLVCAAFAWLVALAGPAAAEPLAAKYLYDGKLVDGEKALQQQLAESPSDDEARFGLGAVQFFRTFERLGAGAHKYGLRTRASILPLPADLAKLLPENPKPEQITYAAFRRMVQDAVDDLNRAEATLAKIKDEKVKMPLAIGRIKLDLCGQGTVVGIPDVVRNIGFKEESKVAERLQVSFDRGDVSWLRGYCHFLAGCGELILALDGEPVFRSLAHRVFRNPATLTKTQVDEENQRADAGDGANGGLTSPAMSLSLLLLKVQTKEPRRMQAALKHLEGMMEQGLEMWKHILAETDNDNEWIPNPRQAGAMGVPVTRDMITIWEGMLTETRDLLRGKKLLPAWGPALPGTGVNLRRIFTNPPRVFDVGGWLQGPAATPFLQKGMTTGLADPRLLAEINRVFPGPRMLSYSFWFN